MDDINKFIKQNPEIKINVFELNDNKQIYPIKITNDNREGCNLLFYKNPYVLCKDVSIYLKNSETHTAYPCLRCFASFRTENKLEEHIEDCKENPEERAEFHKDEYLEFNKFHYKNKVPFVIYGDFEAYNKLSNPNTKNLIYNQKPFCFGIYIKSDYEDLCKSKYKKYYGEDASQIFGDYIIKLHNDFEDKLKTNIPLKMTNKDKINFENAEQCYYCYKPFNEEIEDYLKVRDHDHYNFEI